MNNEYINQIAKAAQEKFEMAKNLILQEMQVAMDKIDNPENDLSKVLADFIGLAIGMDEPCCGDCECDCEECEEEPEMIWINEDAIDWDKPMREICIVIQEDEEGNPIVAFGRDEEVAEAEVPALLGKAIVESLYNDSACNELFTKDEVDALIGDALMKATLKMLIKGMANAVCHKGGEDE